MTLPPKFEFILEIIISFVIVYLYATEIHNRYFLCFSNNQCVTVWDTHIIPNKYYGLIKPLEYAEIDISKKNYIYLSKSSSEILITEPFKNLISSNTIRTVKDINTTSCESFSFWIDDPTPSFLLAKNDEIIRSNLRLITPIISFFLSSTIPFVMILLIVGMVKYYKFSIYETRNRIKTKIILLFKIITESILVIIVIMGISLIFFIGTE